MISFKSSVFNKIQTKKSTLSIDPSLSNGILLCGYMRKLKGKKLKYFVLMDNNSVQPARLEYFDSENSWKCGQIPKRSIFVKSCFNINRTTDEKNKYVVSLYTNKDSLLIAFDNEDELMKWFIALLEIQLGALSIEGGILKPLFEYVWLVKVQDQDLAKENSLVGTHRLCLNTTTYTLVLFRMPLTEPPDMWEFPIMSIRQCGLLGRCFFLEMGRATPTGPGRLWMKVKKTSIAHILHRTVIWAMKDSALNHLNSNLRGECSSVSESGHSINRLGE